MNLPAYLFMSAASKPSFVRVDSAQAARSFRYSRCFAKADAVMGLNDDYEYRGIKNRWGAPEDIYGSPMMNAIIRAIPEAEGLLFGRIDAAVFRPRGRVAALIPMLFAPLPENESTWGYLTL